ncbi:MAG: hypothetical protein GX121_00290 [Ignavibacteria bacterium]|nr:hypothetical protein [Ignavibacteria bacterium]
MEIIRHPIKPEKGKAWHLYMHPYFTKQASNVVRDYIEHFTKEGDTVLDPFAGTGVTAIEALSLRRKANAVDLNPLACFITEQTAAQVDTNLLNKEFNRIEKKIGDLITKYDSMSDEEAEATPIKYWYPKGIRLPKNTDKGYDFVEQLWTKRQLLGLSTLWNEITKIKNEAIREQLKLIFSATISRVNITYNLSMSRQKEGKIRLGDGGAAIFAQYRYWIPKNIIEIKVWESFKRRFKLILRGKEKWNEITDGFSVKDNLTVINASVLDLEQFIETKSIDYIYTDPPYGGNIAYLDLSTMWNAWLGFEINEQTRQNEIIEGGDLEKTQKDYEKLFSNSFEAMSQVIKKDGWLSLVFAHKKLEYWNLIIDSNEESGMEFKGSVYQPTNNSSIHYKKNPANVLCSQRIANFQKTYDRAKKEKPDDLKKFIINELERAIIEQNGAAIDLIYQRILDKLLNNNTIHEAKKKGYLRLENILESSGLFFYDYDNSLYYVKDQGSKYLSYQREYFKNRDELKIYLKSLLAKSKGMTLDEIHKEIFEIYNEEKKFPIDQLHCDLDEILNEIAYKGNHNSTKWFLKTGEQTQMDFGSEILKKLVKIKTSSGSHSETIFRLVQIGKYLNFNCWIGKREQSIDEFQGVKFSDLSISDLPLQCPEEHQLKSISQIDVIWFDKMNNPRYAFEVEESTNILTGFERFVNLLKKDHSLANKIFIIAPKSRKRKISTVFKKSSYIGAPLYLENKVELIFKEELYKFYDKHIEKNFKESDIFRICEKIE